MNLKRAAWRTAVVISITLLAAGVIAYWRSGNACDEPHPAPLHPMKAIVQCDYGPADVLRLEQIEKPVPRDNEVLIKVRAASVNPLDWHYIRGTPYIMRMESGLRKPKSIRRGVDFAGIVEAVGKGVREFQPGDEVFGGRTGALAEYLSVPEDGAVVSKPARLTFEQAASIPVAAITALQALRDKAAVRPRQKVLINGASGGVGTFAVQIAKALGAEVTGVCSTRNVDLVRSLGADHVIDYTREDFVETGQRFDVLMDNVGNRSLRECRRVLAPTGKYVLIGAGGPNDHRWIGPFGRVVQTYALSFFAKQEMGLFISRMNKKDLATLRDLVEAGQVTPVIDRRYTFGQVPEAIKYLETGRARGKVVITLGD